MAVTQMQGLGSLSALLELLILHLVVRRALVVACAAAVVTDAHQWWGSSPEHDGARRGTH